MRIVGADESCRERKTQTKNLKPSAKRSLLPSVDSIAVLARDYFDLLCRHHLIGLHLERSVLHDERPDIVAQTVCV